jgi:hypothetical protein
VGSYQAYSLSVQQNTPGLRNPQRTSLKNNRPKLQKNLAQIGRRQLGIESNQDDFNTGIC